MISRLKDQHRSFVDDPIQLSRHSDLDCLGVGDDAGLVRCWRNASSAFASTSLLGPRRLGREPFYLARQRVVGFLSMAHLRTVDFFSFRLRSDSTNDLVSRFGPAVPRGGYTRSVAQLQNALLRESPRVIYHHGTLRSG